MTRHTPHNNLRGFFVCLVLSAFILGAGCAPVVPPPAPEKAPSRQKGVLQEDRWVYAEGGVYWLNLPDYEPEWPLPEQDFIFGWQKDGMAARLWVLSPNENIAAQAVVLAHRQGWLVDTPRRIGWQGRPAWDARVSDQVLAGRLRLLKTGANILAVAALAPAAKADAKAPELAAMIESLRMLAPGDLLHTVRHPAENLSVVSMWYTGSVRHWPVLQKYNQLQDPKLSLGQDILIPADLVWRWGPRPGWVVRGGQSRKNGETQTKEGPPTEQPKELELLPAGPK